MPEARAMKRTPHHISVEQHEDVCVVGLKNVRLDEKQIHEMADEVISLIEEDNYRKLVFRLGPGAVECLYSVFLAKLVTFQRRLRELGGTLKLSDASPEVYSVFEACKLNEHFDFAPDLASALKKN
jgi:anti-anti-sigma factor